MAVRERTFDTGDVLLNYAESDSNGDALLILHGVTLHWSDMGPLIDALSRNHHVYACDLRGHGKSSHARSGYRIDRYVDDVVQLITQRIRSTTVLVGFSLGGAVAIGAAAALPSMVRGLVLLEPYPIAADIWFEAISESGAYSWITMVQHALAAEGELETARRLQLLRPEISDQDAMGWSRRIRTMDPAAIDSLITNQFLDGADLEDMLRGVQCPALLLAGEVPFGSLVRDEDMAFFLSLVGSSAARRLAGVGHELHLDSVSARILDHMARFVRYP